MTPEARRPQHLGPLAPGTLGRRLVLRVVAIIAATSLALTATSLLALGRAMEGQLDDQVTALAHQQWHESTRPDPPSTRRALPAGSVILVVRSASTSAVIVGDDGVTLHALPAGAMDTLLLVPRDGQVHTVEVEGLGRFRIWAGERPPGPLEPSPPGTTQAEQRVVAIAVGQPLDEVYSFLGTIALIMGGLTLVSIAVAVGVVQGIIRTSLMPLSTLASAADQVTAMNLVTGDVDLDIPEEPDSPGPNSEVTRVGAAIREMFVHVSNALSARQASETKVRQFVADASHELRNPLAAIRGYAEITRRSRDTLPPDMAFALERIDAESERMGRLVEDLLTLAHLDSDPQLSLGEVDLHEVLVNAVSDARVSGPDHRWELDLPDDPVIVVADRHRIAQVLINLLTNARVHTPAGTRVTTSLGVEDSHAVIAVSNDASPIPADKLDVVFERFGRVDPSRQRVGPGSTGLGLAIVRSAVEAHGGTVGLVSVPGETTFTVRLPLSGPTQPALATEGAGPSTSR